MVAGYLAIIALVLSMGGDSTGARNNGAAAEAATPAVSTPATPPNCDDPIITDPACFGQMLPSDPVRGAQGEAGKYDVDEIVEGIFGHTADDWVAADRPSRSLVEQALRNGTPVRYNEPGKTGLVFEWGNVRVIVNESNPFKSTAYYF
jgi:hypothetical protein